MSSRSRAIPITGADSNEVKIVKKHREYMEIAYPRDSDPHGPISRYHAVPSILRDNISEFQPLALCLVCGHILGPEIPPDHKLKCVLGRFDSNCYQSGYMEIAERGAFIKGFHMIEQVNCRMYGSCELNITHVYCKNGKVGNHIGSCSCYRIRGNRRSNCTCYCCVCALRFIQKSRDDCECSACVDMEAILETTPLEPDFRVKRFKLGAVGGGNGIDLNAVGGPHDTLTFGYIICTCGKDTLIPCECGNVFEGPVALENCRNMKGAIRKKKRGGGRGGEEEGTNDY